MMRYINLIQIKRYKFLFHFFLIANLYTISRYMMFIHLLPSKFALSVIKDTSIKYFTQTLLVKRRISDFII